MRNLTLKKVALGLFLAGYAASGAFALTATSSKTVVGTAPTIVAPANPAKNFGYVVKRGTTDISTYTLAADKKIQVGDVIHLYLKYDDIDGDDADDLLNTLKSNLAGGSAKFVVYSYDTTAMAPGADVKPTQITPVVIGTNGEYTYTVLTTDIGNSIGINLTAVSEFGDPSVGITVKDDNLFSATANGDGTTPGGGGIIIPPLTNQLAYIFDVSDIASNVSGLATPNAGAIPLASTVAGAKTPKLGGKYTVTVYDGANNTSPYATTNVLTSTGAATKIEWYVDSGNAAAGGAVPASTSYVVKTNAGSVANANEFTIPSTNAGVFTGTLPGSTVPTTVEAGIQGFKLNVDVVY